jgi:hypothetical protein
VFWGAAKCDYTFKSLEIMVPEVLNSVSIEQIRRYARRSKKFMDAYQKGLIDWKLLMSPNSIVHIGVFLIQL